MRLVERLQYLGPNLRLDRPALELRLQHELTDHGPPEGSRPDLSEQLMALLSDQGVEPNHSAEAAGGPGALDAAEILGWLIQKLLVAAGHHVETRSVFRDEHSHQTCLLLDGDDQESNYAATDLAIRLLNLVSPGLVESDRDEEVVESLEDAISGFFDLARQRVMTTETRAIIRAAKKLGISALPLDRAPFVGIEAARRIRPNGMLMLGHCARQRLLDGPVYIDSRGPALNLLWSQELRLSGLRNMGIPVLEEAPSTHLHKAILSVGGGYQCAFQRQNERWLRIDTKPHPALGGLIGQVARQANAAVVFMELVAEDLSQAPGSPPGVVGVLDFDLAPRLDALLADEEHELGRAAQALVEWSAAANVPSLAITGTNGKTTTSFLARQILRASGKRVGISGSRGVIIGDEQVREGDCAGMLGHLRVFDSREVDTAVLETARGAVSLLGFAFDRCDVAVCTNVAEDHIGLSGIHTLEAMARLKLAIIQKADQAVVLNAEDSFCEFMYERVKAPRIGVVSRSRSPGELKRQFSRAEVFCTVAGTGPSRTIELSDRGQRLMSLDIDDIPISFGGRASFNVENAMQAAVACHLLGASTESMAEGLKSFTPGFEHLMGRLNIHQGKKFTVIMDYAHNEAGLRRFLEFAGQFEHTGKRILVGGVPGDRSERQARGMMQVVHGFYQQFVLRPSGGKKKLKDLMQKPRICHDELLKLGVAEEHIHLSEDPMDAVRKGMTLCDQGDLLVLHLTSSKQAEAWKLVTGQPDNPPVG